MTEKYQYPDSNYCRGCIERSLAQGCVYCVKCGYLTEFYNDSVDGKVCTECLPIDASDDSWKQYISKKVGEREIRCKDCVCDRDGKHEANIPIACQLFRGRLFCRICHKIMLRPCREYIGEDEDYFLGFGCSECSFIACNDCIDKFGLPNGCRANKTVNEYVCGVCKYYGGYKAKRF